LSCLSINIDRLHEMMLRMPSLENGKGGNTDKMEVVKRDIIG
jgi:hypothetical protein